MVILYFVWPKDPPRGAHLAQISLAQVDWLGAALLLLFTTVFTLSIQQAGSRIYAWNSQTIVALLVVAGLALVALIAWQWIVSRMAKLRNIAEILPWRIISDRILMAAIM